MFTYFKFWIQFLKLEIFFIHSIRPYWTYVSPPARLGGTRGPCADSDCFCHILLILCYCYIVSQKSKPPSFCRNFYYNCWPTFSVFHWHVGFIPELWKICNVQIIIPQHPARLQYLELQSLEKRRLNQDLIMCYKIVRGMVDVNLSDFFYIVWF